MIRQSHTFKAVFLTIGKTAALACSIAMAVTMSWLLSRADYGAFSQIITIYALCSVVFQVGIPQSIYFYMPRLVGSEKRGFALQSSILMMAQGAVASLALYFGAGFIGGAWNSPQLPVLLRAFSPYPMLMLPVIAMENVLISEEFPITVVVFNLVSKTMALVAVVLPVLMGLPILVGIQWWMLVALLECTIALILILVLTPGSGLTFRLKYTRDQYLFSLPFGIAAVLGAAGYYMDKIIVNCFGSPEIFAVYVNGAVELPIVGVVAVAVTMSISPSMVVYVKENRLDELIQLWHRSQVKVAAVLFGLLGWLFFFAPETIQLLFSKSYSSGAKLFRVFLLMIPCRLCSFQSIMVPLGLNRSYAVGHLVYVLLMVALCPMLYLEYGLLGASVSAVVALYGVTALLGFFVSRALQIPTASIWAFRRLTINLVLAMCVGFTAWGLLYWIPSETYLLKVVRLVGGGIIFVFLYLLIGTRFGVFNLSEIKAIMSRPMSINRLVSKPINAAERRNA